MHHDYPLNKSWSRVRKIIFRFFFLYFGLYIIAFPVLDMIPILSYVGLLLQSAVMWLVNAFNNYILHFRETLVEHNGSGDTSAEWVKVILFFVLSCIGTILWTLIDRKRSAYNSLYFYLRTTLRYFIAFFSLVYGIIKIFSMQMPFPSLTQLATPLGDYLPMRLSWVFIGYSSPYQIFSGTMELLVFVLLLYRRTISLGLFIGIGVFINVMMLNLCYDVPVKLFSMHLVAMCLFLLTADIKRLVNFFLLNKPATASNLYDYKPSRKSRRIFRIILKSVFALISIFIIADTYSYYKMASAETAGGPIPKGIYETQLFIKNNDTLPVLANDSLIWKDMIFDDNKYVSVNTTDTLLSQRYRRGSFYYEPNTEMKELVCFKFKENDSIYLFTFKYTIDNNILSLWGPVNKDTIRLTLTRSNRKFQLAEKQFHWVSERNR